MINDKISIQERTRKFASRVIKAYIELNKKHYDDAGKVLSKQFLRSGTSIGANCSEAEFAQSRADFLSKYTIALKEASETRYWIQLMIDNNLASEAKFTSMLDELNQIIRILIATTKKLKEK
ncbi:MAG: four helix bundle protein [Xenococcaceae cyanobacterium MO_188.B19]|nr:four helix bundle protein [Xenococcaceae cyanobacterium MO_188.B19]